jgi:hypothetical protein
VDILTILINAKKEQRILTSLEVEGEVKKYRSEGIASSNIRRQLLRLENAVIIEKRERGYRLREFADLSLILDDMKKFIVEPAFERIKEYAEKIDKI